MYDWGNIDLNQNIMSLIQPQSDYFSQCEEEEEEKAIMPPKQVYERANSEAL